MRVTKKINTSGGSQFFDILPISPSSFYDIGIAEIRTLAIPLKFKTLRSSSGESFWFACTSGKTKYNAIATSKPNVPTDKNGRENPPRLYKAEPNAGPI